MTRAITALLAALLWCMSGAAVAQSGLTMQSGSVIYPLGGNPRPVAPSEVGQPAVQGYQPTIAEWLALFASKTDAANDIPNMLAFSTSATKASDGVTVTDWAPAINAAMLSAPTKPVRLPCGVFTLASPLNIPLNNGTGLVGTPGCTILNVSFPVGDVLRLANQYQMVRDITFNSTASRTSGAVVHAAGGYANDLAGLTFTGLYASDAMSIDGANTVFIRDFTCRPAGPGNTNGTAGACVHATGNFVDLHLDHGSAAQWRYGVEVTYGSGIYAHDVDLVQNNNAIMFDPIAASGQSFFGFYATDFLGDTSYADNWYFGGNGPLTDFQVTNGWASSSTTGGGYTFNNPALDGAHFSNSTAIANFGDGYGLIQGKNISINGSAIEYNGNLNGTGGANGIHLASGVSNVTMIGNIIGPQGTPNIASKGYVNLQNFGIKVDAGAGNNILIVGNSAFGNLLANIDIKATGPQVQAVANIGLVSVNTGFTYLPAGSASMVIPTGIAAPDNKINFQLTPSSPLGTCMILGFYASQPVSGNVTVTSNAAPTSNCYYYWRASAWGN